MIETHPTLAQQEFIAKEMLHRRNVRILRIMLLVLIWLLNLWGLILGILLIILLLATNQTVSGKSYLYPLIPFNGAALKRLLVRCRMSNKNS